MTEDEQFKPLLNIFSKIIEVLNPNLIQPQKPGPSYQKNPIFEDTQHSDTKNIKANSHWHGNKENFEPDFQAISSQNLASQYKPTQNDEKINQQTWSSPRNYKTPQKEESTDSKSSQGGDEVMAKSIF